MLKLSKPLLISPLFLIGLTACSLHDNGNSITVGGTAATGAPISNGTVRLQCGGGVLRQAVTTLQGSWQATLPRPALPCAVTISGGTLGAGGAVNGLVLHSLLGAVGVANITPLTDLALARAVNLTLGQTLVQLLGDGSMTPARTGDVAAQVPAAVTVLRGALQSGHYTLPAGVFDPFSAVFTPGSAQDAYDQLLDALAAAIGGAEQYAGAQEGFATSDTPTVPATNMPTPADADGDGVADNTDHCPGTPTGTTVDAQGCPISTPVTSTPLPADRLGVSFDDASAAHLWLQPANQGGITAINGNGDGQVIVRMGDTTQNGPDGTVSFNVLPNKIGTFACGDAIGNSRLHMQVTFQGISDPRKSYVSYQDAADPSQRTLLQGYSCSVTLTHVGSFSSQYVYGDDIIEGSFTAKLRQQTADCAGEGNCSPYKELIVSNGRFRINKSGVYTPPAPAAGTLAAKIGAAYAGTYTVSCPIQGGGTANHTIVIASDGSSTLDDAPVVDATHAGKVSVKGRSVMAQASAVTPQFLLQFTDAGDVAGANNAIRTAADGFQTCSGVSGHVDPAAWNHAQVSAAYARTATVNCTAHNALGGAVATATPQGATTFTLDSDGRYALGQLSVGAADYNAYVTFEAIDNATFHAFSNDQVLSAGSSTASGTVNLALQVDAQGGTKGITFQNNYDQGTCTP